MGEVVGRPLRGRGRRRSGNRILARVDGDLWQILSARAYRVGRLKSPGGAGAHHWESPKHAKCEALGTDLKRELVINVINYQMHHGLGNGLATFTASTI